MPWPLSRKAKAPTVRGFAHRGLRDRMRLAHRERVIILN